MKKVICIIVGILIILFVIGNIMFFNIFGNDKYDLKSISDLQKQNIILFLNCEEITDEIELTEMQIPKVYKDIYYEIYLKTNNNKVKEYVSKAETDVYSIDIKEFKNNIYCCVINRKDSKSIELFESVVNRNVINNTKNEDTNETIVKNAEPQNITQRISDSQVVRSGIISNIDDKYIHYLDSNSTSFYFEKELLTYINGRTFKSMSLSDVKVGDYVYPFRKQILIYRNISGDELNQELLYNLTLTNDERICFVNSVDLEDINISDDNTAIVKISYGDILGTELTDERFNALVEFNENTKYSSKSSQIHSVNDLEYWAKGNINSILLKKDSINKKSPAIVLEFESTDN